MMLAPNPKVSIVIPVFNMERFLDRCLRSVLGQSYKDIEVIIVDDGSTDRSRSIIDSYASLDRRVVTLYQQNEGSGVARNLGLSTSSGSYVYFCDPDDWIDENLIEENVKIMEQWNANMVVFGYFYEFYDGDKLIRQEEHSLQSTFLQNKDDFRMYFSTMINHGLSNQIWTKMYRRDYLTEERCVFSSARMGQDVDFNITVYRNIHRVYINCKSYYHYYREKQTETAVTKFIENKFDIVTRINSKYLELICEYWRYKENDVIWSIERMYLYEVFENVAINLYHKNSHLSRHERMRKLRQILVSDNAKRAFDVVAVPKEIYGLYPKMTLLMVKYQSVLGITCVVRLRHLVTFICKIFQPTKRAQIKNGMVSNDV